MKIEFIYLIVAVYLALAIVLFVVGLLLLDSATEWVEEREFVQDWKLGRSLRLAEGGDRNEALLTVDIRAAQRELRAPIEATRTLPSVNRPILRIVKS